MPSGKLSTHQLASRGAAVGEADGRSRTTKLAIHALLGGLVADPSPRTAGFLDFGEMPAHVFFEFPISRHFSRG